MCILVVLFLTSVVLNTAAADEKIKGHSEESRSSINIHDQMHFSQAVQDIESSGFMASSFKSSRGVGRIDRIICGMIKNHVDFSDNFGLNYRIAFKLSKQLQQCNMYLPTKFHYDISIHIVNQKLISSPLWSNLLTLMALGRKR